MFLNVFMLNPLSPFCQWYSPQLTHLQQFTGVEIVLNQLEVKLGSISQNWNGYEM